MTGYTQHVRRTRNQLCIRRYQQQLRDLSLGEELEDDVAPSLPFNDNSTNFDTGNDDDSYDNDGYDDDGYDNDNNNNDEHVHIAEPQHQLDIPVPDGHHPSRPGLDPVEQTRQASQGRLDIFIEKFAYGRAGSPLDTHDITDHDHYQNMLSDKDNIYAPFSSKMDWEVARWAKLRGLGSTALSDLLAIENVRFHF